MNDQQKSIIQEVQQRIFEQLEDLATDSERFIPNVSLLVDLLESLSLTDELLCGKSNYKDESNVYRFSEATERKLSEAPPIKKTFSKNDIIGQYTVTGGNPPRIQPQAVAQPTQQPFPEPDDLWGTNDQGEPQTIPDRDYYRQPVPTPVNRAYAEDVRAMQSEPVVQYEDNARMQAIPSDAVSRAPHGIGEVMQPLSNALVQQEYRPAVEVMQDDMRRTVDQIRLAVERNPALLGDPTVQFILSNGFIS